MANVTVDQYDAIVIGAGQAGGPLATALAAAGRKTAIVERAAPGGTCVNVGCTPTKTMVASAAAAQWARRGADYGVQAGPVSVNMEVVRKRKRDVVTSFRSSSERRIENAEGLDYLKGQASFTGPHDLLVQMNDGGERRLSARQIFINAGDRPACPQIKGLDTVPAFDSTSIMELGEAPEHLVVLGGGYVGLEFGQMFRRFGSRVTIVQRGDQLLNREDKDVAGEIAKILREDGIDILLNTQASAVELAAGDRMCLSVAGPDGASTIEGSHLLLAAGRVPNTDDLNLPAAGVETDTRGYIKVNERLETNVPGIYGLGDVKGGPAFTHISYDDYRIIKANLLEGGHRTTADRPVPYVVFIDPQLGRIGLSEEEARQQGLKIKVAKMPMSYVARAIETDQQRGFMKAVVDAESEQILGAAVLGMEGGEIMSIIEVAMMGNVPYTRLRDAVFAHPTLAEALNNLFGSFEE